MKILMLIDSLDVGGAESHVVTLSEGLSRMGNDVTVVSRDGELLHLLDTCAVAHINISISKDPFELMSAKRKFEKLVRSGDYDVIHAHTRLWCFVAESVARHYGVRFVSTVHAKFSPKGLRRKFSRWGSSVIVVSEDLRDHVCSGYGICPENTYLIENGIDTKRFRPLKLKNRDTVVFMSRLDADCSDGAYALLRIAPRLKEIFPNVKIRICGGGGEYVAISRLAEKIDNVSVVGSVDPADSAFDDACVFVGVSRAAMEAMACGVSTVFYGNEGYFGAVRDIEELSLLSLGNFCCRGMEKGTDEELFADVLYYLSMSENDRESFGVVLSDYIKLNHSAYVMARKTLRVYEEAVKPTRGRGEVVLCGYYGFGNMGDNSLLRASIRHARDRFGERKISALTKSPKKDERNFRIRCIRRYDPFAVALEIVNAKVLVFGGGTLLQENTSLRSLLYYCALIEFASLCKTKVELWGNGIGMQKTVIGTKMLRSALSKCEYIGLRDKVSIELCKEMLPQKNVVYEPDLALQQLSSDKSRIRYLKQKLSLGDALYVVITVSGADGDGYRDILLSYLLKNVSDEVKLIFVPMFPMVDMRATELLRGEVGGQILCNISESDMVGLMRGAESVLGMRLHSLVFAKAAGTSFVGFGGDSKIECFCRENGGTYFIDLEL